MMNWKRMLLSCGLVMTLGVGAAAAQDATAVPPAGLSGAVPQPTTGATAWLQDVDGNNVGQVTFSEDASGKVIIIANITGLNASGFMGFHIHETGACDASGATPFASAGGHLNPAGVTHPDHAGDLPPLLVNADGSAQLMVATDRFKLADLYDADGSAVVIHSGPDNFANIPERYGQADADTLKAGDSGARIACGVIQQDAAATAG